MKTRKIQSLVWAEEAASKPTHAERMAHVEKHVPAAFRAMVRDLLVEFLPDRILALPTKEARRAAVEDIPLDCDPPWARSLVECRIRFLWKQRDKAG